VTKPEHSPFTSQSMYANAFGFLNFPVSRDLDEADLVIFGIPYDLATTGRAGTRLGPQAVRQASTNLRWENRRWPWSFQLSDKARVLDYGDIEFEPGDSEHMMAAVTQIMEQLTASDKKVLAIGGDHFVTLPLLRGAHSHHGTMALVHFDAHTDTYRDSGRYDHGSMFYHAPKEGLIDPAHSIQLGIRTEYDESNHGFMVIHGDELNDLSINEISDVIRERVQDRPVYLTFDIDCLDPAFAPGTGTPVVGGISTDKALKIIRSLKGVHLVAADVVEVAPAYDHSDITSLAAATILLDLMYLIASDD